MVRDRRARAQGVQKTYGEPERYIIECAGAREL